MTKQPKAGAGVSKHGKPSSLLDTRVVYCGDNLEQLAKLPDGCVDLIYIDPPFNSNRNYEVFWGETKEKRSFEDRHASTQAYERNAVMKQKDVEKFCRRYLLPEFPGWEVVGDLMFQVPIGYMLRGLGINRWSDTEFEVERVVMPLFVPRDSVAFCFGGGRIGSGWQFEKGKESSLAEKLLTEIARDGFLTDARFDTVGKIADLPFEGKTMDAEAIAYARILEGRYADAIPPLDYGIEKFQPDGSPWRGEWQDETLERLQSIKHLLLANPAAAKEQIDEWTQETVKHLKLAKFV